MPSTERLERPHARAWSGARAATRAARPACRRPGHRAPGDQQRVAAPAVAGSASSAARTAWAEPASRSITPRRSTGSVALARSWSQSTSIRIRVAEVEVLGGHDGHRGGGLRARPRQHPVDRRAAAPDAPLGPDVARPPAARVVRRPRPASSPGSPVRARRRASQSPTSSTQSSAVGSRRCSSVGTAPVGQAEQPRVVHPQGGAAQLRLAARPARSTGASADQEPRVEPAQERRRAEGRVGELLDQLAEPASPRPPASPTRPPVGTVSQASSANGARSPSRTTAGIEASKTTSPNSSATSSAWSAVSVSGGVAVSPSTTRRGSCSSSSPSSRPQTSSRWWHSSSTSSERSGVAQPWPPAPAPLSCSRAVSGATRAAPGRVASPPRRGRRRRRPGRSARSRSAPATGPCPGQARPARPGRPTGPGSRCWAQHHGLVDARSVPAPQQPARGLQTDQVLPAPGGSSTQARRAARRPGPVQRVQSQRLVPPQAPGERVIPRRSARRRRAPGGSCAGSR